MVSWFRGRKCRVYGPEMIMEALEERIVLDATVSAVPHDNPNSGTTTDPQAHTTDQGAPAADGGNATTQAAAPAAAPDPAHEVFQQNLHVVLVSNALDRVEAVSAAAADNAKVIVFDAQKDNLNTIGAALDDLSHSTGQKIGVLAIVSHGGEGLVEIGADHISSSNLFKFIPSLEALASDLSQDAQIQFYGCSIAENSDGRGLIDQIAFYTHADVFASSNDTGGNLNDWTLEYVSHEGTPLVQLFNLGNLPTDGAALLYPGRAPLDSLSTCYQYYSALDAQDLHSVIFGQTSYSETWIFTLTATTSVSIGMQTMHPEWSHDHVGQGFIDCWLDIFPYNGTEPVAATRITYNDDWGTAGDTSHAPVYSGNDALIYNYSLAAGTYCIQATHWSDPTTQPQYNLQTGGYYLLSSVELAYWIHNNPNAPTSDGVPNPPTQPEDFTPAYTYDVSQFFSDPQGDTLTYQLGTVTYHGGLALGGLTLNTSTGAFTFTSQAGSSGSVDIQVRAYDPNDYDGNLYSQYYTFTFTVTPQKEWYTESAREWVPVNGSTTVVLTGHDTSLPADSAVKFMIDTDYTVQHGTLTALGGIYHDPSDSEPASTYHQKYTYTPTANYYGEDAFQFTFQVQKGAWNDIQRTTAGTAVGGAYNTNSVQFGDLNNDGFIDIVEGNYNQANKYYLNNGAGTFSEKTLDTVAYNTTSIALGDVNGDGWLDIVVGNTGTQADKVYINQGYGNTFFSTRTWQGFAAGPDVLGSNVGTRYAIALGDLDGDGDLDLVSVRYDNNPDRIHFNDGMGNFSTPTNLPTTYQQYSHAVALGDMDGDGDLDIVVGKYQTNNSGRDIIYFNDGTGSFANPVRFSSSPVNDQTDAVRIGDLDNDGDLDIVTGNNNNAANQVYINNGSGVFTRTAITGTYNTTSIDLGDLDRDGYLDLIIGNNNNGNQANRYYLNSTHNGLFNASVAFSSTYATNSVKLGDIDGDGDLDLLAGNYGQQDRVWTNLGFGTGTTPRMTEPGDVRINVSLMQNPSFEADYSSEHQGGYSGWTIDSDAYSTFAVVKNKYTINDLAPLFDHDTESDVLQVSFGLPYTVKDKTADETEDVAVLLAYGPNAVAFHQDVLIPANGSLTAMDLHWRMAYQNDYVAVDSAPFGATQYIAVYVYDPSGARPAPLWITQDNLNPSLMAAMRDFSVQLPASLVPNHGSATTVRVELELVAQDFFFDVLVDDFRLVPTPPGSVSPGPLNPEGAADMGIAAVMTVGNSSVTLAATSLSTSAASMQEASVTGSSTTSELDVTLMKVLESAAQSPALTVSTVTTETEAPAVNETSSGTSAQPVETAAASGQTVVTAQTTTSQAPQAQIAVSSLPTVESLYQSNPTKAPSQDGTAPTPETGLPPDLSAAIGPVSTVTGDGDLLLSTEFALEPATALVFNLDEMSAWDVLNTQAAAIVGSRDAGLAQVLVAKLSFDDSFVADLDSLRLTEILA